jgi:hypothetical protein
VHPARVLFCICIPHEFFYASRTICIPHEFFSTRYSMIQFHFNFDTKRYAIMSFVCIKHSICIVRICLDVSAPNTRFVFVFFHMQLARVLMDTIRYDTIETICCHVICLHETLDIYCNDLYLCFRTKLSIRVCPA